jgi:hypothetical protein
MGGSTDAIIAFGFDLGEELPESLMTDADDGESFDWWNWLDIYLGLGEEENYNVRSNARKSFPVEFITHCSYDYPMYFLAARGTKQVATRGHPTEVKMAEETPEQIQAMRDFCSKFGIQWREPSWQIFSLWG